MQGEPAEIEELGMALAEVVQHELDAERTEGVKRVGDRDGVRQQHLLSQLEHQVSRVVPRQLEHLVDSRREVRRTGTARERG